MKKFFAVTGVLLAMVILYAGCALAAQPAAEPKDVTGELRYLSVPLEGGDVTLTVQTPQGPQAIQLASNATYELDGKACTVDDIGKALVAGDTTYNCTVVIKDCEPGIQAQYISVFTNVK